MRLTLRHKPILLSKKEYHSSKHRPKLYTLKQRSIQKLESLKKKRKPHTVINTLFLIHGLLTDQRNIIPHNIELITFTQTGNNLPVITAMELMRILRRNSHKLNRIEFGTHKYEFPHAAADGHVIDSYIFTRHYKPFDSYPDLTLSFENTFGELNSLGFYNTSTMNLAIVPIPLAPPIITSTGTVSGLTIPFVLNNNILQLNQPFLLSILLNWISQNTAQNTIVRVYLLCCQGFDIDQPPLTQDMNLNIEEIDFSDQVNGM